MQGNIGFADRARQFAQDAQRPCRVRPAGHRQSAGSAPLFIIGPGAPEFVFVFADGLHAVTPYHRHDQGFGDMRVEQGVAPAQEVDLARGVPPGQDQGILGRMLVDGGRQCGKFGELAVHRDEQFAGAVLPVKQDGRALAAPGGMARGQRLVHAFGIDFISGDGEIRPGFQPKLAEIGTTGPSSLSW